jgi:hypothetical protein
MTSLSRCLILATFLFVAAAFSSMTWGRGGHGGGGGGAGHSNLCGSATTLDVTLSNIDGLIKTSGNQTTALEELKHIAKENAENMSRVCSSDAPMNFTAKAGGRPEASRRGARRRPQARTCRRQVLRHAQQRAEGHRQRPGVLAWLVTRSN